MMRAWEWSSMPGFWLRTSYIWLHNYLRLLHDRTVCWRRHKRFHLGGIVIISARQLTGDEQKLSLAIWRKNYGFWVSFAMKKYKQKDWYCAFSHMWKLKEKDTLKIKYSLLGKRAGREIEMIKDVNRAGWLHQSATGV